jgi:hypothetical protein
MAPDEASLKAARGLSKPGRWPALNSQGSLIWGECQGSGANPYLVVIDAADMGYRCSCPSRKFPCKHTLALMRIVSTNAATITPGAVPQWVTDWLGRRRKTSRNPGAQTPRTQASPPAGESAAPSRRPPSPWGPPRRTKRRKRPQLAEPRPTRWSNPDWKSLKRGSQTSCAWV